MSEFSWKDMVSAIIAKHAIDVEIPPVEESLRFADLILELFQSDEDGREDLAMSMTAVLIEHARNLGDFESVLVLSVRLLPAIRAYGEGGPLIVTGHELRSALFWQYLASGHTDKRLLRASSQLAAAICKCSEQAMLTLEASLTQGVGALTG
jgi:hypothetical protein